VRAARRQLLEKYGGIEGYLRHLREVHAQRLERERDEAEQREAAELGKSA
jgi:Arc/MetJ-type ribon-helix-helix transcriptional regulator